MARHDRVVLDWAAAGGRRIVLATPSRAGLGDAVSKLSTALLVGNQLNASVWVPPPCLMLASAHNFRNEEVCCSRQWTDYLTMERTSSASLQQLTIPQAWAFLLWANHGDTPRVTGCTHVSSTSLATTLSSLEDDACLVFNSVADLTAAAHARYQHGGGHPQPLIRMGSSSAAAHELLPDLARRYSPFYVLHWRRADKAYACNAVDEVSRRWAAAEPLLLRRLPLLVMTNEVQDSRVAALQQALRSSPRIRDVVVLRDDPMLAHVPDNHALYAIETSLKAMAVATMETFGDDEHGDSANHASTLQTRLLPPLCPQHSPSPLPLDTSCRNLPCAYEWSGRRAGLSSAAGACRSAGRGAPGEPFFNQCFDSLVYGPGHQPVHCKAHATPSKQAPL